MKKVLALSLVFALFTISVSAQDQKTKRLQKQRVEQRMPHYNYRGGQFRQPNMMRQNHEMMRHRMMKQRVMRQRAMAQKRAGVQYRMPIQQHRKMMQYRRQMNRRVI